MASTFTPNINLEEPGNGDYSNDWNVPLNSDLTIIDQALGSSTSFAFTNANISPTIAQSAYFLITCTGVLTANVELILPGTIGGGRTVFNQTTGAFSLTLLNGAGDTGGGVVIPQGYPFPVILTAGRAYYDNYASIAPGTPQPFAGANIPPGFLLCYGQAVPQATYPLLYAALGTTWGPATGGNFTLPDYRGITLAGADNMGGTAAGRLTGYVLGTVGGNQAVTLTAAQLPVTAYSDTGHNHAVIDAGHQHPLPTNVASIGASGPGPYDFASSAGSGPSSLVTQIATTGITIAIGHATITNAGGGNSHPVIQPTAAVNWMIRY
jgi:microcystin-dependent protein